jgi:hypothetical protein
MSLSLAIDHSYRVLLDDLRNFQRQISDSSDRDREFKRNLDAVERRISEKEVDLQRAYATVDRLNNDLKQAQARIDSLVVSRGIDHSGDRPSDRLLPVAGVVRAEASDRDESPVRTPISQGGQTSSAPLRNRYAQPAQRDPLKMWGDLPEQSRFGQIEKILLASLVLVVAIVVIVGVSYRLNLFCMNPASLCGPEGEKERSFKTPEYDPLLIPQISEEIPENTLIQEPPDIQGDPRGPSYNPKKKK